MRSTLALLPLLYALGAAAPAAAQVSGPGSEATRALARLAPSAPMRLHLPREGRVTGRFLSASDDSIVLLVGRTRRVVAAETPDSVWIGRRRNGHGALIGGVLGVAAGLGVGVAVSGICSDGGDSGPCTGLIPLGGLAGGAAGGLLGYLLGSGVTGYHRITPR